MIRAVPQVVSCGIERREICLIECTEDVAEE